MDRVRNNVGELCGVTLASLYSFYYAITPSHWHFIDQVDLIFHEAGHVIFMFFGEFVQVSMGSGLQILLPLFVSLYFFYRYQNISGAITLMWVGINFINVSLYAGDAMALQLPLLGGDSVMHDWNYILSSLNLLSSTPQVELILYILGFITIVIGISLAYIFALELKWSDLQKVLQSD